VVVRGTWVILGGGFTFGAFADGVTRVAGPVNGISYNGFESFTIDAGVINDTSNQFDLTVFGGTGGNFWGEFGQNFAAGDYQLELTYRLGPNNTATKVNVEMTQLDGFNGATPRGESFRFDFLGIDGGSTTDFVTLTRDITLLPNPVTESTTEPWGLRQEQFSSPPTAIEDGDMLQDYDVTQGGAPNGLIQMQIQSEFGSIERLNIEVKSIRLVPKTAEPEVARLDGKGFLDSV